MKCQAFEPLDEPGPNPPWTRCQEQATNSISMMFGPATSLFIRCCEEHWNELRLSRTSGFSWPFYTPSPSPSPSPTNETTMTLGDTQREKER